MAATDAKPVPVKAAAFRVYFPIYDADGDPVTSAAGLDSEVSKDGAGFGDCEGEAQEVGNGVYYLDLSATEMTADAVCVAVKTSTSGAKTTLLFLYPEEAGDIRVNAAQFGGQTVTASAGVTVPASIGTSTLDAEEIDTQLSTTHGSGAWGAGGSGANTCTLTLLDGDAAPVVGARVTVKNAAETTTIAGPLVTNASGQVAPNLDAGTYHVLVSTTPAYDALAAQTLVVDGTETATYTLTAFSPTPPADETLCTVYGWLTKPDGTAAEGAVVTARPSAYPAGALETSTRLVTRETVTATCDAAGYFSLDLVQSALVEGQKYSLRCADADFSAEVTVPAAATANVLTLV